MELESNFVNKRNLLTSNSLISNLIPENDINILRKISEQCNGLTFVSGMVIPEVQKSVNGNLKRNSSLFLSSLTTTLMDCLIEDENFDGAETELINIKNKWEKIINRNLIQKKNIEQLESRKMQFVNNTSELQRLCEHSISVLKDLESQANIIQEYIYPYQKYTVLLHKIQNDKLSNNLKEVSNCFEIIDNSIAFFQDHTELRHNDYYIDSYKKLRMKLCFIIKNFMRNILESWTKKNYELNSSETNSQLTPPINNKIENKVNEQNISLYYTQLRTKGKEFNQYLRLLVKRFHATHYNDTYKSAIEEMEHLYINYRLLDDLCGIKSFKRLENKENYLNTSSSNCLTLNIKNYTRLALTYCKYEWTVYNSFFNCHDLFKGKNEMNFLGSTGFEDVFFTETKQVGEKEDGVSDDRLNFNLLIDQFGTEYHTRMSIYIRKMCRDPEILRESISYLSQDIVGISNELYQNIFFPDIYLSTFLHYVLKLQNTLIEQLLFSIETFIKNNIDDYKLNFEELNYPEILTLNNVNRKFIRSLRKTHSAELFENKDLDLEKQAEMNNDNSNFQNDQFDAHFLTENSDNKINYQCEDEILTSVSFPPNTIRLQTNSDVDDLICEDEYFGTSSDINNRKELDTESRKSESKEEVIELAVDDIKVSMGSYPVVRNSLLALSYLYYAVPTSTYLYLNKLIIQKCCSKLISAKEFIINQLYKDDRTSKLYHSNLFVIRNLLHLKYELIIMSKQNQFKDDEIEVIENNIADFLDSKIEDFRANSVNVNSSLDNLNYSPTEMIFDSIKNIIDISLNNHLDELINSICSNISLPLTKIVLQVHPEIQKNDILELQCTNHCFIKESISLFWNNLKLHMNNYLIKYMSTYLFIPGRAEVEALFSSFLISENIDKKKPSLDSTSSFSSDICSRIPYNKHYVDRNKSYTESDFEKKHLNTAISSIVPSSLSIFLTIKSILLEGVIYEFDHVLLKRLEIEKDIIEHELGWKLSEILEFLNSVEMKLRKQNVD